MWSIPEAGALPAGLADPLPSGGRSLSEITHVAVGLALSRRCNMVDTTFRIESMAGKRSRRSRACARPRMTAEQLGYMMQSFDSVRL